MSRFQLSMNVADVDAAVEFYTALLRVGPNKHRPGYANFIVEDPPMKLIVIEDEGTPGTINHLGIELEDTAAVAAETQRIAERGLAVQVDDPHTCCFATQDKAWTRDLDGVPWEIYTVLEDTQHFGLSPEGGTPVDKILPPIQRDDVVVALADPAVVVIDAQGDGGFENGHIPGAVNFGLENVAEQAAGALSDPNQLVVVYCTNKACLGSEFVGTQLVQAGYQNVRRYPGGLADWSESGNTVQTGPAKA
jgi:rhodanese-related sulfurtransferase